VVAPATLGRHEGVVVNIVKNIVSVVLFIVFSIAMSALLPFLAVQYPLLGLLLAVLLIVGFTQLFMPKKKAPSQQS
jgi:hypothetical protein